MANAVFTVDGNHVHASALARGPWDPNAQHGGAPAALLMRALELTEPDPSLTVARVTYELLRPVPLGNLQIRTEVIRGGRRVKLLEAVLSTPDGTDVVRARGLKLVRATVDRIDTPEHVPPPPESASASDFTPGGQPMFGGEALELRFVAGAFEQEGPATTWFRLRTNIVDGEPPSPLQRLAAAADFPNGIGSALSWRDYTFINPDLTLYVEREPVGEWICLDAHMRVHDGGIGLAEAVLYDRGGRVGRSLQSLVVSPR